MRAYIYVEFPASLADECQRRSSKQLGVLQATVDRLRSRHRPRQTRTEDSPGHILIRDGQGMFTNISKPETQRRRASRRK